MDYDAQHSFKDYTGHSLKHLDFSNKTIYASCFSQELPDSEIFSSTTTGVTFIRCNLSNVKLPTGSVVQDCNLTRFKLQNDLRDWEIDENNQPVKCLNEKFWIMQGISVNPQDIPSEPISLDPDDGDLIKKLKEIMGVS